jgi:hypothetical protein
MAIDLTIPIDITAVNNTYRKFEKDIRTLDKYNVMDALKYFSPRYNVKGRTTLVEAQHNNNGSGKYIGQFNKDRNIGKLVPRDLFVYPCVYEMSDEPERYRTTYLADVARGNWTNDDAHPFERWLIEYGITNASEDLYQVLWNAKYDASSTKLALGDSFDGIAELIRQGKTASSDDYKISVAQGNMFEVTGPYTAANIGERLLAQFRAAPEIFKQYGGIIFLSVSMGELYDDWYKSIHDAPPMVDTSGQTILDGTNGKCKLIRLGCIPAGDQTVILTKDGNITWGTDNVNDLRGLKAFNSGNPYVFTATMKYVFGLQIESIHPRKFIVNEILPEPEPDPPAQGGGGSGSSGD